MSLGTLAYLILVVVAYAGFMIVLGVYWIWSSIGETRPRRAAEQHTTPAEPPTRKAT